MGLLVSVDWSTLITAVAGVAVGAIGLVSAVGVQWLQQKSTRNAAAADDRRSPYRDYLTAAEEALEDVCQKLGSAAGRLEGELRFTRSKNPAAPTDQPVAHPSTPPIAADQSIIADLFGSGKKGLDRTRGGLERHASPSVWGCALVFEDAFESYRIARALMASAPPLRVLEPRLILRRWPGHHLLPKAARACKRDILSGSHLPGAKPPWYLHIWTNPTPSEAYAFSTERRAKQALIRLRAAIMNET